MPFRERLKKTFSRRSSATPSQASDGSGPDRNSSIFYQPGEKLPIKYRRPAEASHMAKLEGFNFGNAWRRRSTHSQYSPMGSRMPSRQNSISSPSTAPIPEELLSYSSAEARRRSSTTARGIGQSAMTRLDTIESVPTHVSEPVSAIHNPTSLGSADSKPPKSTSTSTAASSS